MNKRKLAKLRRELENLRKRVGNISQGEMIRFARRCGRVRGNKKRGDEPAYVSTLLSNRTPLSIPGHARNIPPGTAKSILSELDTDLFLIEEQLDAEAGEQND